MIYQLHWQNRLNIRETEFVAQAGSDDFPDPEAHLNHFLEIIERRRDECPDGWGPMICDETSNLFVLTTPAMRP